MNGLNEEQIRRFHREGYLLVESVFSNEDLRPIITEFENAIDEKARELFSQGKISSLYESEGFERRLTLINRESEEAFHALFGKSHHGQALFDLMHHNKLLDLVGSLVGQEIFCHPNYNVRPKLPELEQTVVPWHQDSGYLEPEADGTLIVGCWVPLVDATPLNGCLEVIVGSHKHGIIQHKNVYNYLEIDPLHLCEGEKRVVPVAKGGVFLLSNLTVHRSGANLSDTIRWSVDLRYQDPSKPTGRGFIPGFLVRSASRPTEVLHDRRQWIQSLRDAGYFDVGKVKTGPNPFAFRTDWGRK